MVTQEGSYGSEVGTVGYESGGVGVAEAVHGEAIAKDFMDSVVYGQTDADRGGEDTAVCGDSPAGCEERFEDVHGSFRDRDGPHSITILNRSEVIGTPTGPGILSPDVDLTVPEVNVRCAEAPDFSQAGSCGGSQCRKKNT